MNFGSKTFSAEVQSLAKTHFEAAVKQILGTTQMVQHMCFGPFFGKACLVLYMHHLLGYWQAEVGRTGRTKESIEVHSERK